jgi:hypothetical protein
MRNVSFYSDTSPLPAWRDPNDLALQYASSAATRRIAADLAVLLTPPTPSSSTAETRAEESIEARLYNALAAVKVYTAQVAMHMDANWRTRLFRQLDNLLDVNEWAEDDCPLRQESFATFLKTMFLFKPERRPGLGLSEAGNIIGAWTEEDARLTIECLPGDKARWVISHDIEGHPERAAGETVVTRLAEVLEPYDLRRWLDRGVQR